MSLSEANSGSGVLAGLRATYPGMTATNQRIATLILNEPETILHAPVADIAARSGTSQAAVSRFTARMGFGGLSEFKIALAGDVAVGTSRNRSAAVNAADSASEILRKIAADNEQAMRDTLEVIETAELNKAVLALRAAQLIVVVGVGQMGYLAADVTLKLRQTGKTVVSSSDYVEQLALSQRAGRRDVFLLVSYEGAAPPLLYNAEEARARGATVIGICRAGRPPLREHLDHHLGLSAQGAEFRTPAQSAHVAILTVIDALVVSMLAKDPEAAAAFAQFDALLKSEQLE